MLMQLYAAVKRVTVLADGEPLDQDTLDFYAGKMMKQLIDLMFIYTP